MEKIHNEGSSFSFNVPYFSIDNARVIYTKRSKFVKNEHARYTAVYISLGCALYIRCALSIEKYGIMLSVIVQNKAFVCSEQAVCV